jgi:single-stranded DNA-binding protein
MSSTLVVIEGSLAGEPVVKYTAKGAALANFEMAVANGYGKNAKDPFVFKVTAWNDLAESLAQLAPGTKFTMYGRLTSRNYEWQGQQKTSTDIVANTIDVRKTDNEQAPPARTPAARPQQTQQIADEDIPF